MKVVVCECGARNVVGGDCIICGRPLGSIGKAAVAAAAAASLLGVGWFLFAWLTGIQALWFGLLFGVAVSGAVVQVSFGRGWAYQAIATLATVTGIVVGETLLILAFEGRLGLLWSATQPNLGALEAVRHTLVDDEWALIFCVCGVMGGAWVWKQPSSSEDR